MTRIVSIPALVVVLSGCLNCASSFAEESNGGNWALSVVQELKLGTPIGQCRAVPVELGKGMDRAILVVYCADAGLDPWSEMLNRNKQSSTTVTKESRCSRNSFNRPTQWTASEASVLHTE